MAESFFNKIADDVLVATEHIQTVLEEGFGVLFSTTASDGGATDSSSSSFQQNNFARGGGGKEPDWDDMSEEEVEKLLAEEMMDSSPLNGIANNVLGNIMSTQVRNVIRNNYDNKNMIGNRLLVPKEMMTLYWCYFFLPLFPFTFLLLLSLLLLLALPHFTVSLLYYPDWTTNS
jgi:hypothetical protein